MSRLVQISKPSNEESIVKGGISVGIDFGTTNSILCFVDADSNMHFAKDGESEIMPSVVAIDESGIVCAGSEAVQFAKENNGVILVRSIKRLLDLDRFGMTFGSETEEYIEVKNAPILLSNGAKVVVCKKSNLPGILAFGKIYTCLDISRKIIQKLVAVARGSILELKDRNFSAVVTVPAYFGDAARNMVKLAVEMESLTVKRVLNEPTAAAVGYGLDNAENGNYVVYDLGGGTFDVSVLRLQNGVFQTLSTSGDTQLGGDDFDAIFTGLMLKKIESCILNKDFFGDKNNVGSIEQLKKMIIDDVAQTYLTPDSIKKLKYELSKSNKDSIKITFSFCIDCTEKSYTVEVFLSEFENEISDLVQKTVDITKSAILDSGVEQEDIKGILLVGGATRTKLVRKTLETVYNKIEFRSVDIDKIVAVGAGVQAAMLDKRRKRHLLLDIVPLSIGVETFGGAVDFIIHRNSPIPLSKFAEFTTAASNQTSVVFNIVQGERAMAKYCMRIGQLVIPCLPGYVGQQVIKLKMKVDSDGLLTTTVYSSSSDEIQEIEVRPLYNLDMEKIKQVLYDSTVNIRKDLDEARVVDIRNNAAMAIIHTKQILQRFGDNLSLESVVEIEKVISVLEEAMLNQEKDLSLENVRSIKEKHTLLETAMLPIVEQYVAFVGKQAIEEELISNANRSSE